MSDDRITVTGELKLPEGADVEAFKMAWQELQQEHGRLIYAMPAPTDEWQAFMAKAHQVACEKLGVDFAIDSTLAFEPDGHFDADGNPVITAVPLVRRKP